MSKWYYADQGTKSGPYSEADIASLFESNKISSSTLVWIADFGSEWKAFSVTNLFQSLTRNDTMPPPIPNTYHVAKEHSDTSLADRADDVFLTSKSTKVLVGRKFEAYYLSKWELILRKTKGDPTAVSKKTSWNWPAFLLPFAWLLYRKMYLLGGLAFGWQLFAVLSPDSISKAVNAGSLGLSIVTGLYGNSWYFEHIRKKWLLLRNQKDSSRALSIASVQGGVNQFAPWVALATLILCAFTPVLADGSVDFLSSKVSCSAEETTGLVSSIAKEQIDKDSYMKFVVDSGKTKVRLASIRTRNADAKVADCAAIISYGIVMKQGADDANVKSALEQALGKDITYKVERTDKGDEIYATVYGLN